MTGMDPQPRETHRYKPAAWARQQIVREHGVVEDICEHGVGHPNKEWMGRHDPEGERGYGIHGCDGCCREGRTDV